MNYVFLILSLMTAFSLQASPTCSKFGTKIIYTNGVTTIKDDANIALRKIKELNLNRSIDLKSTSYKLGYNYEESIAIDFLEAAVQRIPNFYLNQVGTKDPYTAFSNFYYGSGLKLIALQIYLKTLEALSIDFNQSLNNYLATQKNNPKYIQTVNEIKELYLAAFNNKEKVFAISHSQGGLFMNDIFNLLPDDYKKENIFLDFKLQHL